MVGTIQEVANFLLYHGGRIGIGLIVMLLAMLLCILAVVGVNVGWAALTRRWPLERTREIAALVGSFAVLALVVVAFGFAAWGLGDDILGGTK